MATAGTIATASAAARPPGTHHPRRKSPCEAAEYTTKNASPAMKIQRLECDSGRARRSTYDPAATA
jgi:hypothetical protein